MEAQFSLLFFFVGPTTKEAMESGRISVFLYNKGEANLIQVMSELRDPDRYVQRLPKYEK